MAFLITLFASKGLSRPLATILAYLAVAAALAGIVLWLRADARADEHARASLSMKRAEAAALRINAAAHRIADAQRTADTTRIATQDKERLDAVQAAPPSRTGAATRSLGCVRLHQAGRDRDAIAAGC